MAKVKQPLKKITVSRISDTGNLRKFMNFLQEKYACKPIEDKGQYVAGHCRVRLQKDQEVDVVIYTTDNVLIRSSPKVPINQFDTISSAIEKLAQQATRPISEIRPLTLQRASTILEYASSLKTEDELQRMVIVILCDTSNEIVLREQMKALGFQGPALDEGIPDKIRKIEGKGQVVHRGDEVKNTRELRNGIVHQGQIPDKHQAEKCLEIAKGLLEHA